MLNNKSIQTFLAIGPLILFALCFISYFLFFFSLFMDIEQLENSGPPPTTFFAGMAIFLIIFFLAMILSLLSLIYFVIHAAKNPNLEEGSSRVVWILIIVLVSGIGNFIYWIAEIQVKNPKPVITG